ncbi:MAG: hypothetical protein RLY14_956 [Planctomycetota bacterium]|jgi:anaerobic glycerol-3-phosphate dehydrogenase
MLCVGKHCMQCGRRAESVFLPGILGDPSQKKMPKLAEVAGTMATTDTAPQ